MSHLRIFAFADEADASMSGQVSAMVRNGLQGLEIRGVDGENISKITPHKAREVRRMLNDHGLSVWSMGSPIGKIRLDEDFEAHMDLFRYVVDLADIMGVSNIRMFSFYTQQHEGVRNQIIDRLARMLQECEGTGISLCHENEKGIYGDTADHCVELLQALPQLHAVFDPANFVQCGEDTLRAWALLKDRVKYLHIKDALPDGSVVPAGKGEGNIPYIVKDYIARGGREMTLEPHLAVFEGLKGLEESGDVSVVGQRYTFASAEAAFDAGCDALKAILQEVTA